MADRPYEVAFIIDMTVVVKFGSDTERVSNNKIVALPIIITGALYELNEAS